MTPPIMIPKSDSELKIKELHRWTHGETILILLVNQVKACYTMRLIKNGRVIGESTDEENNIGKLLVLLLDEVPIDPKYIKLN
jgi:hypothetical protein